MRNPSVKPCAVLGLLLVIHASLLAWSGICHSPNGNEPAHLAAGVVTWQQGRLDLYRVNPPLVRTIAALPAALWCPYEFMPVPAETGARSELSLAASLLTHIPPEQSIWLFILGRWLLIPLCLIGPVVCSTWAGRLYGTNSGILAATFWCFSPHMLAWGSTICPDAAASSLGVLAAFRYRQWLNQPTIPNSLWSGICLGIAMLAKFTWFYLLLLWPIVWTVWAATSPKGRHSGSWLQQLSMLGLILLVGLFVLNAGYGFEGTMKPLGQFEFTSSALAGEKESASGNRFNPSVIGHIPIPFPENFLSGIDYLQHDFENKRWSYLRGEWRHGGWWYYYLYAFCIKTPIGLQVILVASIICGLSLHGYSAGWRDEAFLAVLALSILVLVSSQTGINRFFRYAIPALPFIYISASKIARCFMRPHAWFTKALLILTVWSSASSLWVFPHCQAYFNELVGGPRFGHQHLLHANIDWNQDLFYLQKWKKQYSDSPSLYVDVRAEFSSVYGIAAPKPPADFPPGWYILSVNSLYGRDERYKPFQSLRPAERIAYSYLLYKVDRPLWCKKSIPSNASIIQKQLINNQSAETSPNSLMP